MGEGQSAQAQAADLKLKRQMLSARHLCNGAAVHGQNARAAQL